MNRTNKILAVVLALQLVILGISAVWSRSNDDENSAPGEALIAGFEASNVTQMTITDQDGKTITVAEGEGGNWVLPDYGDYPIDGMKVINLLQKLKGLQTDRLITRSETSHRRLQVSDDEFVRLIEFDQADGKSHKLYLGKTGGGSTVHVRLDDQSQVYLVGDLSSQDANALPNGWIDTLYFSADSTQVISLSLQNANGELLFSKSGDAWTLDGLTGDETLTQEKLTELLSFATAVRISEPIGKEAKDEYGLAAPQATVTLRVLEPVAAADAAEPADVASALGGEPTADPAVPTATPQMEEKEYSFVIGAEIEGGVVLKASTSDYYVLVPKATAERFTLKTRADFVTLPPTPTPEPTIDPAQITPEPMSTAEPTVEPTAEPTVEPTAKP